jgi:hypothetical protein
MPLGPGDPYLRRLGSAVINKVALFMMAMPMSSYVSHAYLRRPTPAIINNSELFSMA